MTLGCNTWEMVTAFVRLFLLSPPMCTNLVFACLFVVDIFGPKSTEHSLETYTSINVLSSMSDCRSLQGLLDCVDNGGWLVSMGHCRVPGGDCGLSAYYLMPR